MSLIKTVLRRSSDAILVPFGYQIRRKSSVLWEPVGLDGLIPPRDLWEGPNDPLYWFFGYFWEYRAYLTLLCELRVDHSVLELGCSHGRTMLALLDYLKPPGRYEGLDINRKKIEFAQNNIHSRYPHFNFTAADVHSSVYNPQGKQKGDSYKFPYEDGSFDVVYGASIFTHLVPRDAANYLKESRRVLRKDGRCLFSFFVLDYYRGPGTSTARIYEFEHPLADCDEVAVFEAQVPENVIAYKSTLIRKLASEAGFEVVRIVPGFWSKTHKVAVNEQDLILLKAV
ncbi:MAG TPA: class I SAM-dependent methyltransferase [Pyrinomonadaceae bacterium]